MNLQKRLNLIKERHKQRKWDKEHRDWIELSYRFDDRRDFIYENQIGGDT